jgi:LCP family protein required for cell wall assembly
VNSDKNNNSDENHGKKIKRVEGGKRKKSGKTLRITIGVILLLIIISMIALKILIQPPELDQSGPANPNASASAEPSGTAIPQNPEDDETPPSLATAAGHKDYCYTFLIVGVDELDAGSNTDTIMIGMLDTQANKLNVISIPRDTIANVPWTSTKKINSIYSSQMPIGGDKTGLEALKYGIRQFVGYDVDSYVIIDVEAFQKLVDSIGGVNFDVPVDMYWTDTTRNLYISLQKGYQLLNGYQAMGLVRFRSSNPESNAAGYVIPDFGRINTQQAFLKATASQMLSIGNITKVGEWAKIFKDDVETSLNLGNIVWLGRQLLKLSADDITFSRIPSDVTEYINGSSYVTIHQEEWLEVINSSLNPFYQDITAENLDLLMWDAVRNQGVTSSGEIVPKNQF